MFYQEIRRVYDGLRISNNFFNCQKNVYFDIHKTMNTYEIEHPQFNEARFNPAIE